MSRSGSQAKVNLNIQLIKISNEQLNLGLVVYLFSVFPSLVYRELVLLRYAHVIVEIALTVYNVIAHVLPDLLNQSCRASALHMIGQVNNRNKKS